MEVDDSFFGTIVGDIRCSLSGLHSSYFSHVPREANGVAHKLARFSLLSGCFHRWYGVCPSSLVPFWN